MKAERIIDPEKIELINIKTLKGKIDSGAETDSNTINSYHFKNDVAIAMNLDENAVGLKLTVYIDTKDKQGQLLEIKGSYTHEFIFKVENLDDFVDPKEEGEEQNNVDPFMIATLAGIAYSTLRGIMYIRTQGTALNTVILPVVDPKKLIGLTIAEEKEANK